MGKSLIVFYSFSKNTRKLAEEIARHTGGDLRELVPEKPYSFDYNTAVKQVRYEIEQEICPKLISGEEAADSYDYIFIGSPNWLKSYAPPVLSFLRHIDLSDKTIIPFCTHGGGGFGKMEQNIIKELPGSKFLPGLAATGAFDPKEISEWLQKIGVLD
jgi:flavodoxin